VQWRAGLNVCYSEGMTTERAILVQTIYASFIDGVRKSVKVEAYEIRVGLNAADLRGFEIRTDTGYRAVFPRVHTECTRIVCVKHDEFTAPTKESGTHCHGLHHLEQIMVVAKEVARTYGGEAENVAKPINAPTAKRVATLSVRDWAATEWAQTMEVAG